MNYCSKCSTKIVRHLWIVDKVIFCGPFCERGKFHRYNDKMVEKIGVAGLKRKQ